MKNLVLVRIDDRLIHGQVVTQWIKTCHGNRILIIDDALLKSTMMMRILKAAAPPGVAVEVLSVEDAIHDLKGEPVKDENIVILVKVPAVLEALLDSGIPIPQIILGGMGLTPNRKKFNKNVAASDEEVACMKRVVSKGSSLLYQLVPSDMPVNVEKLL